MNGLYCIAYEERFNILGEFETINLQEGYDSIVELTVLESDIYIPNIIIPYDRTNNNFKVIFNCGLADYLMSQQACLP